MATSSSLVSSRVSDKSIYERASKDSDERLRNELKRAQDFFESKDIDSMTRTDLIVNASKLRKLAGQIESVKTLISGFNPNQMSLDLDDFGNVSTPSTPSGSHLTREVGTASPRFLPPVPVQPSDTAAMMAMFMTMMNSQAEQRKEEARLIREEAERKELRLAEERKEEARLIREEAERKELRLAEERKEESRLQREEADRKDRLLREELERKEIRLAEDRKTEVEIRKKELENQLAAIEKQSKLFEASSREASDRYLEDRDRVRAEAKKLESRLAKAHTLMKPLMYAMPSDPNELTLYLDNMEKLFTSYKIDDDLRIPLLTPHLTDVARRALLNMSQDVLTSYPKWKEALLNQYQLSSTAYRQNYLAATRQSGESWCQFATRLGCLFKYYLSSRDVGNSYQKLVALLLSDKLKDLLPNYVKFHVLDREDNAGWMEVDKMAQIIDRYEADRCRRIECVSTSVSTSGSHDNHSYKSTSSTVVDGSGKKGDSGSSKSFPYKSTNYKSRIRCFACNLEGHLARDCSSKTAEKSQPKGGATNNSSKTSSSSTRACYICNSTDHIARFCNKKKGSGTGKDSQKHVRRVGASSKSQSEASETIPKAMINRVSSTNSDEPSVSQLEDLYVKTSPSQTFITVDFGAGPVECLVDSGCDISVLKPQMLPVGLLASKEGSSIVTLEAAFGQQRTAKLINVPAHLVDRQKDTRHSNILLTCAVTSDLNGEVALITVADYESLLRQSEECIPEVKMLAGTSLFYEDPESKKNSHGDRLESVVMAVMDVNAISEGRSVMKVSNEVLPLSTDVLRVEELVDFQLEQVSDISLKTCWDSVGHEKSTFLVRPDNKLLYHKVSVGGFEVHQLVLPESRRRMILEKAHDSDWSMHFGSEKTKKRIEAHFYWPTLSSDVKDYVSSCASCQKSARKTKYDRIPISPVARAATSFEQVNIDLIGPIDPKSSRGHQYILCLIDNCTRWVEAVAMKSLTAKELCEALISIFTRIGIPRIIISDNGTNMVAGLTQELYQRLGVELRRSTALHPEGNSLVERFNGNLKKMLRHVVNSDHPREWDRRLPYLLWAYRELPNATTGLSPYQLVYGRTSRGPLSVLKDTWAGDRTEVPMLNDTAQKYLEDLKVNLQVGLDLAEENAAKAQAAYTNQYNAISKEKDFEVGDLVLVLIPDSTNKLLAQWLGPATVVAKVSPHSYRISLDSGAVRVLHANHLRPFVARVSSVGVIFEEDEDFGKIEYCPTSLDKVSDELSRLDLSYLKEKERGELLQLLQKYRHIFNDKPGFCNVAEHEINIESGFKPKSMHPFRIPDKLKVEVDRQIDELLRDGKIRLSRSPFAHPILCVAKPNGDIRICTDMRYVNSGTINDAYPMPRAEDMLMKVSSSTFLTTLDCTSGYWQIPIREEDISKTAFITHRGLYEWTVMAFGLKTAGNTFQRVMDIILAPFVYCAGAYIDDTIVHSGGWKDHLTDLEGVFAAFSDAGMTLKLSKCHFAKPSVRFIGHEVGSGKRKVILSKVEAIRAIPEPHTKKLLRSFLGMVNFYRNYIPDFSRLALPLTDLTKTTQSNNIRFGEKERAAFLALKDSLCHSVTLHSPRQDRPFIVRTDASNYAVGACLSQLNDDGEEMPIAFASAKLSAVQSRWAVIEKEAYAIIFALQKFDVIIYGSRIDLYSDHSPLRYLVDCAPKSPKLTRWSLSLSRYNIHVHYIKGVDNVAADFLSRCVA